ncbi:MAG: short-chain dehydrogenase, partial [Sulfuritalea sp.]|nr:short-chain dehydrogenase [Sulfuritalea sp.]
STSTCAGATAGCSATDTAVARQGNGRNAPAASVAGYRGSAQAGGLAGRPKASLINSAVKPRISGPGPRGISENRINPGFVATPMTAGNDFEMPALISPQEAAEEILAGFARGSFEMHFPRRFTRWLKLLRLLPYPLYFALVRRFTKL